VVGDEAPAVAGALADFAEGERPHAFAADQVDGAGHQALLGVLATLKLGTTTRRLARGLLIWLGHGRTH
jgi:hypothetical protein